jgi:hypothetical protein
MTALDKSLTKFLAGSVEQVNDLGEMGTSTDGEPVGECVQVDGVEVA